MKRLMLSMLLAAGAAGASTLSLVPNDGAIQGTPGSTVGWGFRLTADLVDWISIVGVVPVSEDNPGLGTFTDFISPQGGPDFGALAPGGPDWVQTFDAANYLGFGSYTIDPAAMPGQHDAGGFLVLYETFTDNPATCGSCFDTSGSTTLPFQVNIVATPEPGTCAMLGLGLAMVALRRARR